jgi:hypothetical protein
LAQPVPELDSKIQQDMATQHQLWNPEDNNIQQDTEFQEMQLQWMM